MILSSTLLVALAAAGTTPASAVPVEYEPMHHPVYANQLLRVLDVVIPAHARTLYHTHTHDIAGVTISPGPFRSEEAGIPAVDEPPDEPGNVWFEAHQTPYTHRGTNLGERPIHLVAVELLGRQDQVGRPVSGDDGGEAVQLENARIRVVRFSLEQGESAPAHSHHGTYALVALNTGRLSDACGQPGPRAIADAGFICVGDDAPHQISNAGDSLITVLEFEVMQ